MAYTQTWDPAYNATPAGAAQLSGGDDSIRNLKRELYERLLTLVNDINADPLTLQSATLGTIGAHTGHVMVFGGNIFEAVNDDDDTRHEDSGFEHQDNGQTSYANLYLPNGITIQKLQASMDRSLSPDVSLELYKINYHTGAKTVLDTVVRAVGGIGLSDGAIAYPVPGIGEVVDSVNFVYGCRFFAGAFALTNPKILAVKLTVDVPGVSALP